MEKKNDEISQHYTYEIINLVCYRMEKKQMNDHEQYRIAEIQQKSMIYNSFSTSYKLIILLQKKEDLERLLEKWIEKRLSKLRR